MSQEFALDVDDAHLEIGHQNEYPLAGVGAAQPHVVHLTSRD